MADVTYDTLIVSDLHLGSELSRARDARDLLQEARYRRLILLGDIFSDLNFRRLTRDHWKFLSFIRKLSNPKRGVEVVWVEGNHDRGLAHLMSHLVGVPVHQRYFWQFEGKRHLAVHGHQFDFFNRSGFLLGRAGEFLYHEFQKVDFRGKGFSRFLDRLNTRFLGLSTKVANGALAYARHRAIDRIFCGHTHAALELERHGVAYYNTGCWVSSQPTFVTVGEEGVRIHVYSGIDYSDSSQERGQDFTATADQFVRPRLSVAG